MSSVLYGAAGAVALFALVFLTVLAIYECVADHRQASRNRKDREREARIEAFEARLAALRRVSFRQILEDWQDRPSIPSKRLEQTMSDINGPDLDRHITGNYGQDRERDEPDEEYDPDDFDHDEDGGYRLLENADTILDAIRDDA